MFFIPFGFFFSLIQFLYQTDTAVSDENIIGRDFGAAGGGSNIFAVRLFDAQY